MCSTCNQSKPTGDCPACAPDPEDELLTCYDCESEFHKSELEKYEGLTLCPDCLRNYKLELAIDYNEYDE